MYLELEPITCGPGRSYASSVLEGPRIACPYHRHPEFELVAIDASSGRMVAGNHTGTFHEGDVFLLGENLPHIFQNSPIGHRSLRHARWHVIQFRRDFAGAGLFDVPEFASVQRLLHSARSGLKITGSHRKRIREQMAAVHEATGPWRIPRLLELLCLMASARSSFKPLAKGEYDILANPSDGRMPGVIAYIQENFTGSLSVPGAARKAGLTPNAFCRYFKQQTNRTFTDFVNEMRVEEACRLLRETKASVTVICHAAGFGNFPHFHSEFKKRMRVSPLKFRWQVAGVVGPAPRSTSPPC